MNVHLTVGDDEHLGTRIPLVEDHLPAAERPGPNASGELS